MFDREDNSPWSVFVFALAVFFIIMGIIGLLSPAHSFENYSCANMAKVGNTIIAVNGEPEERSKEWFNHFRQVFFHLGFVADFPNVDVEKVMIVPSKSSNIVIIGFYIDKCLIDEALFIELDAYEATVAAMNKNRL